MLLLFSFLQQHKICVNKGVTWGSSWYSHPENKGSSSLKKKIPWVSIFITEMRNQERRNASPNLGLYLFHANIRYCMINLQITKGRSKFLHWRRSSHYTGVVHLTFARQDMLRTEYWLCYIPTAVTLWRCSVYHSTKLLRDPSTSPLHLFLN